MLQAVSKKARCNRWNTFSYIKSGNPRAASPAGMDATQLHGGNKDCLPRLAIRPIRLIAPLARSPARRRANSGAFRKSEMPEQEIELIAALLIWAFRAWFANASPDWAAACCETCKVGVPFGARAVTW
ncbi:uncharacterized protein VTP21DRAFT_2214 [Calcarisporiella thermophila]|uniref:uncharacterized protein n=1 Tax=Calcarisporiella thermophila TaxID=911321 RepID=UPI003743EE8F